jgi:hypothetical protein
MVPGVSHLCRKLDDVSRSKRQPKIRHVAARRHQAPAAVSGPSRPVSQLSPPQLLEQIKRARIAREEAEAELEMLIDHAVGVGIGWPEVAAQLGVSRQAARQHYQRRHRQASHPSRVA